MKQTESNNDINLIMFFGAYCALFFLSPIVYYYGLSTSLTAGTIGVLVPWIMINFFYRLKLKGGMSFNTHVISILCFTSIFFICHFFSMFFYFQYDANFSRGFLSLFLVVFFIYCAFEFSKYLSIVNNNQIDLAMKIAFIIFFIIFFLSFFKTIQPRYSKSIFPYTESSHFALFFVGCLYYTVARYKKYRLLFLIMALIMALTIKNLTLLVAVIILAFCLFKFWFVFIGTAIGIFVYNFFDLSYFTDRVENISSADSSNLSSLVFVQGWELAIDALKKSSGLGIGLQQLGEIKLYSRASNLIYLLTRTEFNISDAGLTAPKIICEFGIFGILGIIVFLIVTVKGILIIRKYDRANISNNKLLAYSFLVSFFTELFVRGVGYFVGSFFMVIASLAYIFYYSKYFPLKKTEL